MSDLTSVFKKNRCWEDVQHILNKLESAGFVAYLAGGCIRDALLGKAPKDFDIATAAHPDEIIKLFPNSNKQGKAFGVVAVYCANKKTQVEVATFRKDGPYTDGRHPESVTFLSEKEDALRRDFTINALFYHCKKNRIIDYVNGQEDLKNKLIRTVGDAKKRFTEDKLRILRAFRFHVQLGFQIEPDTKALAMEMKSSLLDISRERIYEECVKMLATNKLLDTVTALRDLNILAQIQPSWKTANWNHCIKFWENINTLTNDITLLWVRALFPLMIQTSYMYIHKKGYWHEHFSHTLKEWKFSSKLINNIRDIFFSACCIPPLRHMKGVSIIASSHTSLAQKLKCLNTPWLKEVIFLSQLYGKHVLQQRLGLQELEQLKAEFNKRSVDGTTLPSALITGEDLKQLGVREDHIMAYYLEQLYDQQLTDCVLEKKLMLDRANKLLTQHESVSIESLD